MSKFMNILAFTWKNIFTIWIGFVAIICAAYGSSLINNGNRTDGLLAFILAVNFATLLPRTWTKG